MSPSHFSAAVIFALCISVVFGITQRTEPRKMLHFGAYCFGLFLVCTIAASWVMWVIHH